MFKFKVGDTVECLAPYHPNLEKGKHYIVIGINNNGNIRLSGLTLTSWDSNRFKLVEETPVMSSNPAIEEYTKTVTVRKVRSKTTLKFEGSNAVQVMSAGSTVELRTVGHRREHIYLNASDLRILARQLIEIADVLDEQKD